MSRKTKILGWTIFIFHLIGAIGTVMPHTRDDVLPFTSFNLVLSAVVLALGHQNNWKKFILYFLVTFLTGFFIEAIGVKTGFLFGHYAYGDTLGLKVLEVPVVIGINWFVLSYIFGMLYKNVEIPILLKITLAALSMVALDLLIEPVAIRLGYWVWKGGEIPLKNYIGWFFVAIAMQFCFIILKNSKTNLLVIPLIVSQIIYFTLVFIFY